MKREELEKRVAELKKIIKKNYSSKDRPGEKEWLYRKGYELHRTGLEIRWYHFMFFWVIIDHLMFYKKHFVEFINEKGEIRRVYLK